MTEVERGQCTAELLDLLVTTRQELDEAAEGTDEEATHHAAGQARTIEAIAGVLGVEEPEANADDFEARHYWRGARKALASALRILCVLPALLILA